MKKRITGILLTIVMVLGIVPLSVFTAFAKENKTVKIPAASDSQELNSESKAIQGEYAVTRSTLCFNRLSVSGEASILLCDGVTLRVPRGINVPEGSTLKISSQSDGGEMGMLIINSVHTGCAGIGSEVREQNAGTIIINGGNISVKGGEFAAGIGGAKRGGSGTVIINGGVVSAIGGKDWDIVSKSEYTGGAGIGGGYKGETQNITVNGGTVTAVGAKDATAFKGTYGKVTGTISIAQNAAVKVNDTISVTDPAKFAEAGIDNEKIFIKIPAAVCASGHSGEWRVTKEAACAEDGVRSLICKNCGKVLQEDKIPANGHSFDENGKCIACGYEDEASSQSSDDEPGRIASMPGGQPVIKVTELPRVDKQGYIKNNTKSDDVNYEENSQNSNSENNNAGEPRTQANTQNGNQTDKNAVEASADTETGSSLSGATVWIIAGVAAAVIIAAVVYVVLKKKKRQSP